VRYKDFIDNLEIRRTLTDKEETKMGKICSVTSKNRRTLIMNKNKYFSEGTIVKLKNPADDVEGKALFEVIENKGDRVDIKLLNTKMSIPPVECVSINEIVIANPK